MTIEEDKQRIAAIEDGTLPPSFAKTKEPFPIKRGRGRPKGSAKEFISELPAPPKRLTFKPEELFTYLQSIPKDKLTRVMLVFYRYFPICDITEGGEKDRWIRRIAGESHPFVDDEWMKHILHMFGSGTYGCYLNEQNAEGSSQTRMECKNIETIWDPDSYPPVVDPKTLIWTADKNQVYVQWLRGQGVQPPSEADREIEEMEMQVADTISKLTDTVIAQANRINTPVPQVQQQPSMVEKLSFEMASSAIDIMKEKSKVEMASASQQTNGLELVDKVVGMAKEIAGSNKNNNGDDTLKLMLKDAMDERRAANERNERLMERMFAQRDNPSAAPKTLIEQMREMAEMRVLMQQAFGNGSDAGGGEAEEKPGKESIPEVLIKSLPQLMQHGMGMWGQLNQTLAYRTRLAEIEALKASGQLPNGAAPIQVPVVQQQSAQQQQTTQPTDPATGQPQPEINPATNQPYTQAENEARNAKQQEYAKYHGFISMIAQPLVTHLNDVEKDGYDFAEWFIAGNGRLMYDNIKTIPPDDLMGAIESYPPLWQVIGGAKDKVKEFVGEFLTLDEYLAEQPDEEKEQ